LSGQSRKVAVVMHEAELGGASRAVLRVVPLLEERGWRFSFWIPSGGGLEAAVRQRGYPVAGAPRLLRYGWSTLRASPGAAQRLRSLPGYFRRLRAWLREEDPALVHVNTVTALPEAVAARREGRRVLLHVHEMLGVGLRSAVAGWVAGRSCDLVVAVSRSSADALSRRGVAAEVIPNGVRAPLTPVARDRGAGGVVVGTLGTVSRRKGSDVFVAAARLVMKEEPGTEFRMVGPLADGPEREWAEAVVEAARAAGIVYGMTDHPFAELSEWDLFALPSREDPFPLATLEAMASGLPVIASGIDGIVEQVTEGAGVLIEPDHPAALAAAMVELIRAPERRREMGEAGFRNVTRGLTLERQAERFDAAYARLAEAA
jgi:glycosyltransferase involved in cell wall biosynthesis